jgi:hypothetical protein
MILRIETRIFEASRHFPESQATWPNRWVIRFIPIWGGKPRDSYKSIVMSD